MSFGIYTFEDIGIFLKDFSFIKDYNVVERDGSIDIDIIVPFFRSLFYKVKTVEEISSRLSPRLPISVSAKLNVKWRK